MSASTGAPGAGQHYSAVAIVLHWAMAGLIVTNITLGLQVDDLKGMALFNLLQWHKSIGVTVLTLAVLRLVWRLVHKAPPFPAAMKPWERWAAFAVHAGFYLLIVALPLSGWIMVSASPTNIPTVLYQAIPWPHIGYVHHLALDQRKAVEDAMADTHEWLARAMILLLILHVAAALKHQFFDRDQVLWRMLPLPGLKPRRLSSEEV